jgi:DNA-binding protein YbaB
MNERWNESRQVTGADFRHRLSEIRKMQQEVRDVTATARTRDGLVRIEVGARGELRDLHLDARVYDRLNPTQLAHAIMRLAREATTEATGRAREMTAAFLPEDMAARFRDGEEDLTALLPEPPSVDG